MSELTVLETIAYHLKTYGTEIVYGLPSDDLELMESIQKQEIEYLIVKDQRNAMFMATGHALVTKKLGVCNIGKGPALSNSMTGILEAKSQCAPLLIIASGTDTINNGKGKSFQEADQLNIVTPLVKWSHRIENKESIEWVLKKAVFMATNGTSGPVYIEVPENIGQEMVSKREIHLNSYNCLKPVPNQETIEEIKMKITHSERPVILLGGGSKGVKDKNLIKHFAEQIGAPIFVSASGRGSVDENHHLFCGLGGLYCPERMIGLVQKCDLFIVLGSSLEETVIFGWEEVLKSVETIEININEEYFNLDMDSLKVIGELELTVKELVKQFTTPVQRHIWQEEVQEQKVKMWLDKEKSTGKSNTLKVADVLEVMQTNSNPLSTFVHENGLQDMWSYFYPYLVLKGEQDSIVPSEQTSLGFGCAAAIGVAKARPNHTVIAFVGDGAFNMFSPELATLISNKIPIIYIVLRNGGYGWLEYQNNTAQKPLFVDKTLPLITINHDQLRTLQVSTKSELESSWSRALQLHSQGKTVVFAVNVELTDVPVALTKIYGNFPEKNTYIFNGDKQNNSVNLNVNKLPSVK